MAHTSFVNNLGEFKVAAGFKWEPWFFGCSCKVARGAHLTKMLERVYYSLTTCSWVILELDIIEVW